MNKLSKHGIGLLIGLSILLSGCFLNNWDPLTQDIERRILNNSSVEVVFGVRAWGSNFIDTLKAGENVIHGIMGQEEYERRDLYIEKLNIIHRSGGHFFIYMLSDTTKGKRWYGPDGFFGDSIHSPFNHNSWKYEKYKNPKDVTKVGSATFTITDADLK